MQYPTLLAICTLILCCSFNLLQGSPISDNEASRERRSANAANDVQKVEVFSKLAEGKNRVKRSLQSFIDGFAEFFAKDDKTGTSAVGKMFNKGLEIVTNALGSITGQKPARSQQA